MEKWVRMAVCTDMQNFLNVFAEVWGDMVAQHLELPPPSSKVQVTVCMAFCVFSQCLHGFPFLRALWFLPMFKKHGGKWIAVIVSMYSEL